MAESDLDLLPTALASRSINDREIVLPLTEALAAIDHLEGAGRHLLGWEGWLLYPDGGVGHSARHQGTADLSMLTPAEAADFCRETIRLAAAEFEADAEPVGRKLIFCISVN